MDFLALALSSASTLSFLSISLLFALGAAVTFDLHVARGIHAGDGFHKRVVKIIGPSTYTTGGDAVSASDMKLGRIEYWPPTVLPATTGAATAVVAVYNYTTGKLQFFWQTGASGAAALPEVDNGTNLSDYTGRTLVHGTS